MPKKEEFDYELQKHLEKEIPELLMPIKPSLDEIVCGFLRTFDVFVKPSSLAKRDPLGDAVTGGILGAAIMGFLFNLWGANALMSFSWINHLIVGGFAFGIVFMATDPVSAAQTTKGKWIYGFLVGIFCIMIRVFNPAYPEGVMLAILLMNVFAPTIDYYVINGNINKRKKRWNTVSENLKTA